MKGEIMARATLYLFGIVHPKPILKVEDLVLHNRQEINKVKYTCTCNGEEVNETNCYGDNLTVKYDCAAD